jgi:hypothetical protein
MTASRDTDRLIRAFLDEGTTELPDVAFDAVRRDIHRTRQRVVIGPWREPDMSNLARVAIAAAAVIAVGFAWVNFGPSQSPGVAGRPSPSPAISPAPSPSAAPSVSVGGVQDLKTYGPVAPGRYRLAVSVDGTASTPRLLVTVPAGWTTDDGKFIFKDYGSDAGLGVGSWNIDGTVVDPCTDHTPVQPKPSGIDALAQALTHQPKTTAKPPPDVTIDGYRGKVVEVTVATDISKCGNGLDGFWIWTSSSGDGRYVQDSDETDRIWILDVTGQRFTFNVRIPARTTAADRAEFETMLKTIEIEPRT